MYLNIIYNLKDWAQKGIEVFFAQDPDVIIFRKALNGTKGRLMRPHSLYSNIPISDENHLEKTDISITVG